MGRHACPVCCSTTCSSSCSGAADTCKGTFAYYAIEIYTPETSSSASTDLHSTSGKNEISSGEEVASAEDVDPAEVGASNEANFTGTGSGNAGTGDTIVEGSVLYSSMAARSTPEEAGGAQIPAEVEVSVEA